MPEGEPYIARQLAEHLEPRADHVAMQVLGDGDEKALLAALSELARPLGLTHAS